MDEKIIYSLNTEDVQMVALEKINRQLTVAEIDKIEDLIAKRIDWYGIIDNSIDEMDI